MDADIAEAATRVAQALEGAGVDYAIGGALALGIHGTLRATLSRRARRERIHQVKAARSSAVNGSTSAG